MHISSPTTIRHKRSPRKKSSGETTKKCDHSKHREKNHVTRENVIEFR